MEKIIKLLLVIILFSSCSLERRIEKAQTLARANPSSFSELCADLFPVKSIFIKGKDSIRTEIELRTDTITTIRTVNGKTDTIRTICPTNKTITKYIYKVDTLVKENTAKISAAVNEKNKYVTLYVKEKEAKEGAQKSAKNRLWILLGIVGLVGVGVFLKIKGWLPF